MAFRICKLNSRDMSRAYALIERVMPGLEPGQWTAFTAEVELQRAWFVARDGEGYVRGLCHVAVRGMGDRRRQLEVPLLVAAGLVEDAEIERRLLATASAYGAARGCTTLHVWAVIPSSLAMLTEYLDRGPWDHGMTVRIDGETDPDQPIRPVKM